MRVASAIAFCFSAALLAACATTATPGAANAPAPGASALLLRQAGARDAPDLATIEHTLGGADIRRQDGAGFALTYRLDSCALLLLFAADTHNTMRLVDAHASPRRAGLPQPSLEQCGQEADQRRAASR